MEIRDVHALLGRAAYGADGDRLGTISGAYLDKVTGRPSWITVERSGLLRTTRSFVPLDGVELVDDGVRVAVDGDAVKRAPDVDDDRVLSTAEEQELRAHYGLATSPPPDTEAETTAPRGTTDQAEVIRSEERPRVATRTVPASRAVLRRTRVVEDRTFSVPLGRDQVQVVYEPLADTGSGAAADPSPQGAPKAGAGVDADDEGWVVLYEERLVVRTEWVPVERVRLGTVGVQGEEVVQVDLRREHIDVDRTDAGDGGRS